MKIVESAVSPFFLPKEKGAGGMSSCREGGRGMGSGDNSPQPLSAKQRGAIYLTLFTAKQCNSIYVCML